jgi:hypothetical protein
VTEGVICKRLRIHAGLPVSGSGPAQAPLRPRTMISPPHAAPGHAPPTGPSGIAGPGSRTPAGQHYPPQTLQAIKNRPPQPWSIAVTGSLQLSSMWTTEPCLARASTILWFHLLLMASNKGMGGVGLTPNLRRRRTIVAFIRLTASPKSSSPKSTVVLSPSSTRSLRRCWETSGARCSQTLSADSRRVYTQVANILAHLIPHSPEC